MLSKNSYGLVLFFVVVVVPSNDNKDGKRGNIAVEDKQMQDKKRRGLCYNVEMKCH